MNQLQKVFERLSDRHCMALSWFVKHSGTRQLWPTPLDDGTLLVIRPRVIYKPRWLDYILSLRLDSRNILSSPKVDFDNTWSFCLYLDDYFLHNQDFFEVQSALIKTYKDGIPVGVMEQIYIENQLVYYVWGVAMISEWKNDHFFFKSFPHSDEAHEYFLKSDLLQSVSQNNHTLFEYGYFDLNNIFDARKKSLALIIERQGQSSFRRALIEAYEQKCAISSCDVVEVLEAAHIIPYYGPYTNHLSNGLLLRSDLHVLFDLGLLAINTTNMTVVISPKLYETVYQEFKGAKLRIPKKKNYKPSREALDQHRAWSNL